MAQRTKTVLIDDRDGGEASQRVQFALDGEGYEIDLSDSNAAQLRDDLAVWVQRARRSGSRATGRRLRIVREA